MVNGFKQKEGRFGLDVKAFDMVSNSMLLFRLERHGLLEQTVQWMRNWL